THALHTACRLRLRLEGLGVALVVADVRALAAASPALSRNLAVQGLRGVAAVAVVLFHARGWFPAGAGAWPFDERFGVLGVTVFFAISGMLMAGVVARTRPGRLLSPPLGPLFPRFLVLV